MGGFCNVHLFYYYSLMCKEKKRRKKQISLKNKSKHTKTKQKIAKAYYVTYRNQFENASSNFDPIDNPDHPFHYTRRKPTHRQSMITYHSKKISYTAPPLRNL